MPDPFYNLDVEQYGARPKRTDLWCACGTSWRVCQEQGVACCSGCKHDRPLVGKGSRSPRCTRCGAPGETYGCKTCAELELLTDEEQARDAHYDDLNKRRKEEGF